MAHEAPVDGIPCALFADGMCRCSTHEDSRHGALARIMTWLLDTRGVAAATHDCAIKLDAHCDLVIADCGGGAFDPAASAAAATTAATTAAAPAAAPAGAGTRGAHALGLGAVLRRRRFLSCGLDGLREGLSGCHHRGGGVLIAR